MASGRSTKGRGGSRVRRALSRGDRPYVLILLALVVVVAAMAIGPLQVFTDAADRVDDLERQRDNLQEDVDALEEQRQRLEDPEEVERLARSDLGMVREGEIPFVVIPPDEDAFAPEAEDEPGDEDLPWYRRLGRWVGERFGGDE